MKLLVCGSRWWSDREPIFDWLVKFAAAEKGNVLVIQGGARGADSLAAGIARDLKLKVVTVEADWDRHGRSAGAIRNRAMLDLNPELVLAFRVSRDSPGTDDTIGEARRRGIPVQLVRQEHSGAYYEELMESPSRSST